MGTVCVLVRYGNYAYLYCYSAGAHRVRVRKHIPLVCSYQNRYQYLYIIDIVLVWVRSLFCGKSIGAGGMGTAWVPVGALVFGIVNGTRTHLPSLLMTSYILKWGCQKPRC